MEIRPSARRHGVADADIAHALAHALSAIDLEPTEVSANRILCLGPDRAANLLEVVVVSDDEGEPRVIHAMPMRDQYRRYLPRP